MNLSVQDDTLRTFVGAAGVFTTLVVFTEHTIRSLAPVLILSAGMLAYSGVNETYDLPNGTNWLVYGIEPIGRRTAGDTPVSPVRSTARR